LMRVNVGLLRHDRHRTVIACAPGGGPKHPYPVFKTGTSVSRDLKIPQVCIGKWAALRSTSYWHESGLLRASYGESRLTPQVVLTQRLYLAFASASSERSSHSRRRTPMHLLSPAIPS